MFACCWALLKCMYDVQLPQHYTFVQVLLVLASWIRCVLVLVVCRHSQQARCGMEPADLSTPAVPTSPDVAIVMSGMSEWQHVVWWLVCRACGRHGQH